jgi:hypothetical protein
MAARKGAGNFESALMTKGRRGCRSAASSTFEVPQEVIRQGGIEVGRDGERPGGQAERPWPAGGRAERAEFGYRPALAGNDEVLPGLNAVEEAGGVSLQVLQADGRHVTIISPRWGGAEASPASSYLW